MSDETVVSEIEPDAEVAQPAPKPEQEDPKQVSDSDKAMKLWEHCCACVEKGHKITTRSKGGQHTVLDIYNL